MEEDEEALNDIIDDIDLDDTWEVVDASDYLDPYYYDMTGDDFFPEDYGDEYGDEDYYTIDVTVPEDLAAPVIQDIVDDIDEYYPEEDLTAAGNTTTSVV